MSVRELLVPLLEVRFLRFCVTGGIGFVADAVILMTLVQGFSASAVAARLISFSFAVLVTFELNRRWTFGDTDARSYGSMLAAYLGVQSIGFVCNLLVYTCTYLWLQPLSGSPVIALAIASVVALIVNYTGAQRLVFGRK